MDSNYTKSSLLPVNPLREWRTSRICKKPEIDLVGYSRSADTTFFFLPQLKIGLDAGECRGRNPPFVFLTHTHADHSRALPWLLSKDGGMDCYCPASTIPFVKRYAQAEFELNCVSSNVESAPYRLHGVVGWFFFCPQKFFSKLSTFFISPFSIKTFSESKCLINRRRQIQVRTRKQAFSGSC